MKKNSGLTLIEIIISVIIIGILSSITLVGISKYIETSWEKKAKLNLKLLLEDEKDFYGYHARFTDEWNLLSVKKPVDEKYAYEITEATYNDVEITATLKDEDRGFTINTDGEIEEF
ncbi:MAG: prepilin-type N-terminal cleavage/methylation domain-containing protein [Candidatus Gorgyraea atricola]|nr:prepilin-type N-terminal cleavage/methylation domain-containing protein [Candidatus Gorgyraea atricola]